MLESKTSSVFETDTRTLPSKAYAAQLPTSPLAPWNFERRAVGPMYCYK